MRSKAEIAALERVYAAARAMREAWRVDQHFDVYFGGIKPLFDAVDGADAVLARAGAPVRRSSPRSEAG